MAAPADGEAAPGLDPTVFRSRPGRPMTLAPEAKELLARLGGHRDRAGALSARPYNIAISQTHRFVWFRNAKVGTRTILTYLLEQHDDTELLVASAIPYPVHAFADWFKFALVRHPLDRFISSWQDKVHRQNHFRFDPPTRERMQTIENFAAWVAEQDLGSADTDRHIRLQTRMVDLTHLDYLGRMETFDADFAHVCRVVGLPERVPERRNQSTPRGVTRENASAELRSIIEEQYRIDYQVFGY
ncbi:sulfotransferase family 2 domain-containing protein [Nocardioides coralli]|uniref:sulfotransferase family 2 domain-containing protein n=1 Tax=Nocardioides coralli TaxID=2872154 RepID=UPI001CA46771|nr:sulfotransferase family 2 domain-containing protein [Nocardioides coralli]QZY30052.1 sulfotransferase family protein [Nocardioides coralli]